jgi:hypothetical protein
MNIIAILTVLSFVLSFCAIVIPSILSYISKRYDLKIKQLEYQQENIIKNYETILEAFQDFTAHSGAILSRIDSKEAPTTDELQRFEASCLKCLLFLEENNREAFQRFRILVKIRFGHTDPRAKSPIPSLLGSDSILKALGGRPADDTYSSFNQCVTIAKEMLQTILQQE